ncbi:Por secretion system C-terminal sorting domain-containing protein [Mariniphaga anaerophila]|uniref:Por secretion system C-terminal sorting domain-containing protein n=1 Tax=Mariniphaga anaerophila TaxID=1484053 RepID=A0A1M4Y4A1_9BACT|nr:T9SS type A sorting domain-containing protein [Mariniphaga anaerophila]SHF00581.1 Por secretion system C-terminal sorting domain-containing protein [Mariniphaga anaerophila]
MKKLIFVLLATAFCLTSVAQKKIYADYHGVRRTRVHDGDFGEWKYASKLQNNITGVKQLTYNPDLILENGQHNIAAADYPLVGMQSQYDSDYIEYEILSAKSAGIDGFFVEWGYVDHTSNTLLQKMLDVAKKYNFEIGVNLCDGWLMEKNWYPGSREEKVDYFIECMQYLIDNVFSVSTAPLVKGKPVMYLFHSGFTAAEFKKVREHEYAYPATYPVKSGDRFPQVIMRTPLQPEMVDGVYSPKSPVTQAGQEWIQTNRVVPVPWIPERIRDARTVYPKFNRYATADDCILYLKAFADNVWRTGMPVKSGFVFPGMDNYGCGGWSSTGKLYYIPHEEGKTYGKLWEYNLQYKQQLDMIYIASWSDYTEGHQIEPTVQNGNSYLDMTLKYATDFKENLSDDNSGIGLSYELFILKKQMREFSKSGINTNELSDLLNAVGLKIGQGLYSDAAISLSSAEKKCAAIQAAIIETKYLLSEDDLSITGEKNAEGAYNLSLSKTGISINNANLKEELQKKNYEGYLTFEYWDDTWGNNMNIVSETDRTPRDLFKIVAQIKDEGLGQWKKARVRLYKENIRYGSGASIDISFYGNSSGTAKIRNISMDFTVFTPDISSSSWKPYNADATNVYYSGGKIHITLGTNIQTKASLNIYSVDGRCVYSTQVNAPSETVGMEMLNHGIYVFQLVAAGKSYSDKFFH